MLIGRVGDTLSRVCCPGEGLLIIPDLDLFTLSWAALQDKDSRFLIEHNATQIRLAPSLRLSAPSPQPVGLRCAVVGN